MQEATAPCWAAEHGQDAGPVVPQEEEEPFTPEIQRDDMCEGLSEWDSERFDYSSQSVGLINVERMYDVCRSDEPRMLGNSGCDWAESQITGSLQTKYW